VFSACVELLASVVREAQSSNENSSSRDAKSLAGFILSAWQGTLLRVRATRDPEPLRSFSACFNVLGLGLSAAARTASVCADQLRWFGKTKYLAPVARFA
jgi:TetR/AcrR family transcriptional repressor of nem operon